VIKEKNKGTFTKTLAIAGMLLAWIPIGFTVLTSAVGTVAMRSFHFDYLMPAELFLFALAGAVLLIWAGIRSVLRLKMIGASSVLAAFFLAACMTVAAVTGMASGRTEAAGLPFFMTMLMLALYTVSLIGIGTGGVLLWKDLFKKR
jgi:uncharacterized protein YfiM (DUF2279 family)